MQINPLFKENELVNLQTYLNKHNIQNIKDFISPPIQYIENPMLFKNIRQGIDLIKKYINRHIYLLVDADCDGYTSAGELYLHLKRINPNIKITPLIHKVKLHGLNDEFILNYLLTVEPTLLIIPDANGNREQCKKLVDKGYEILAINHHEVDEHEYICEINNQFQQDIINKNGSGAQVTHQFLRALDNEFGVKYAKDYIDLCMFGNIGDSMPMNTIYNRIYNFYGFNHINNPFFKELCQRFILDRNKEIDIHNISFFIIPKINATIRSENYQLKKDLFKAIVSEIDYKEIVDKCEICHKEQIENVQKITNDIKSMVDAQDKVIIIKYDDMLKSYTGLVAGRISDLFNRPCVIVKDKNGKFVGSMRSNVSIKDIFNQSEYCDWCEGHQKSAGIQLNNLDGFRDYCKTLDISFDTCVQVTQSLNAQLPIPSHLFYSFEHCEQLWGKDIPKPQFHIHNIKIKGSDITLAKNDKTIMFNYNGVKYIKFSTNQDLRDKLHIGENQWIMLEIICEFGLNYYQGRITPNIYINDLEVTEMQNNIISIDDIF